ncbi:Uncharacterized protein dnm_039880 [Desulfonema magnum]|uniref:Uncharacterized protein n=1 Tax=Desulfonema magnum TaxID=45655 RepID=A0A975BLK0_9BACT|nr:Uncharacterized protein dnm_039880 [Desulfonema magnum]
MARSGLKKTAIDQQIRTASVGLTNPTVSVRICQSEPSKTELFPKLFDSLKLQVLSSEMNTMRRKYFENS